ncbi:PRELI domain-containing protein 1, mitochondrial [Parasteatoda tepidariorum]|uniref:PRELI domain-containing protein 1, mitochondrial n=1 Tax=Parasteatoda tepidariorum TaxID=114398 RepID=UPI00077FA118|nr:PRELI domain-containing protein 1, mitochondrial [Parasteatoda tepidariorum]
MKFFEGEDIFHYSWHQIAEVFWFRYPNPFSKHVRTEDVLYRKVEDGILHTMRLLTKTVRFTSFGYNIAIKNEPIIEESFIDPVNKTIRTCTWNIGTSVARIKELCFYKEKERSSFAVERKAWIERTRLYLPSLFESYLIHRFQKNVQKTCKGLEFVLAQKYPSSVAVEIKPSSFLDKEKICEKARKAKDIAASKTVPLFAAAYAAGADKQG